MQELFPFVSGAIIGLVVQQLSSTRLKVILFVVLCVIFGFLASYFSGELEVWWGFITFDMLLVWLGGLLAVGAVEAWRRRATFRR